MKPTLHQVGNVQFAVTERPGGLDLEQITPGPLASHLTQEQANELLKVLKRHVKRRMPGPAPRVKCEHCGREIAVVGGHLSWHGEQESAPGREPVKCPGSDALIVNPTGRRAP